MSVPPIANTAPAVTVAVVGAVTVAREPVPAASKSTPKADMSASVLATECPRAATSTSPATTTVPAKVDAMGASVSARAPT